MFAFSKSVKQNAIFIFAVFIWIFVGIFYPHFVNKQKFAPLISYLNSTSEHSFTIEKTPTKSTSNFGNSSYYMVGTLDKKYKASGFVNTDDQYIIGETLLIKAHFSLNTSPSDENLAKFSSAKVIKKQTEKGLKNYLIASHKNLLKNCQNLNNKDAGALLCGVVMGDRSLFSSNFDNVMKNISLTHITAVSGMHISILLAFIFTLLNLFGVGKFFKSIISGVFLFIFMTFVGFSPSVLRAGLMGAIMLISIIYGRKRDSLRILGIVIIILLIQNFYISRKIAFILSVTSTFAIIKASPIVQKFLSKYMPRLLSQIISIPLTAQLFCSPIIILFSGKISVIGVLANILIVPFVPFVSIFGLFFCFLHIKFFLYTAYFVCLLIVKVANYLNDVPFSSITLFTGIKASVALGLIIILIVLFFAKILNKRRKFNKFAFFLVIILFLFIFPTPVKKNFNSKGILQNYQVVFCDVGQGNGEIVAIGNNSGILIDAGPKDGNIDKCVEKAGVKTIPLAIFTHLHADHIAGLELVKKYKINQIVTNNFCNSTEGINVLNDYQESTPDVKIQQIDSKNGIFAFDISNIKFTIIPSKLDKLCNSSQSSDGDGKLVNNSGITIIVTFENINYWFLGDLETEGQESLLTDLGKIPIAQGQNVILMAHHGSSRQFNELATFLHPALTVVSVGKKNPYGHPTETALKLYENTGSKIARTDTCGDVSTKLENGHIVASCAGD